MKAAGLVRALGEGFRESEAWEGALVYEEPPRTIVIQPGTRLWKLLVELVASRKAVCQLRRDCGQKDEEIRGISLDYEEAAKVPPAVFVLMRGDVYEGGQSIMGVFTTREAARRAAHAIMNAPSEDYRKTMGERWQWHEDEDEEDSWWSGCDQVAIERCTVKP